MLTAVARVSDNLIGTGKGVPVIVVPVTVVIGFCGTMRMALGEDVRTHALEKCKNTANFYSNVVVEKYTGLWENSHELALKNSPGEGIEVVEVKLYDIKLIYCEMQRYHRFAEGKACLKYSLALFYRQNGVYKVHHTRDLSTCCLHTFNTPPLPGCRLIFTYEYKILDVLVHCQPYYRRLNFRMTALPRVAINPGCQAMPVMKIT
ncbi:MAG TPA: hypothetical protein VN426_08215 [Syntrophomonadaceae bacterium]|nr:hypothetical protein [Syntrophomonadaceae bacterium]